MNIHFPSEKLILLDFSTPQGGYHISPFSWGTNQKGSEGGLGETPFPYRKILLKLAENSVFGQQKSCSLISVRLGGGRYPPVPLVKEFPLPSLVCKGLGPSLICVRSVHGIFILSKLQSIWKQLRIGTLHLAECVTKDSPGSCHLCLTLIIHRLGHRSSEKHHSGLSADQTTLASD